LLVVVMVGLSAFDRNGGLLNAIAVEEVHFAVFVEDGHRFTTMFAFCRSHRVRKISPRAQIGSIRV